MESPESERRVRLRVSLLSLLLLTGMIASSTAAALLWREVGPLRREVAKLRTETGRLTVTDPTKIYVVRIDSLEEDTWKWRVYLPPGPTYELRKLIGRVPGRASAISVPEWFQAGGFNCSSEISAGEFLITVSLRPYTTDASPPNGNWSLVVTSRQAATATQSSSGHCGSEGMDWMNDRRTRGWTSGDALTGEQREFDATRGLELLTILRSEVTETAAGWSTASPNVTIENDGAAVWIVPRKE